jgi:DNA-binding IclR family transcriptional regulator
MDSLLSSGDAAETRRQAPRRQNELGSLQKGLQALRALNREEALTARELAARIGVSRTSARRILDTLATAGLVDKVSFGLHYRLAPAAAALSSGLSQEHVLSHVAAPLLEAATREIGWMISLVTVRDCHMVLQVSTQEKAPYAITHFRFREKIPIVASQAGTLAMAYMKDDEREEIYARMATMVDPTLRNPHLTPAQAASIRQKGYFIPSLRDQQESHVHVPVFMGDNVPGCLILRYFVSAVPYTELEQRYVPLLRALSGEISARATAMMREGLPVWTTQGSIGSLKPTGGSAGLYQAE